MDKIIRLEFNEKQKAFHFERLENIWTYEPNTNGWETIASKMSMYDADKFFDYFNHVHKNRKKWTSILVHQEYEWYKLHLSYCKMKDNFKIIPDIPFNN